MPIPHPSYLFCESTEPLKHPLPLEAQRVHFCWSPLVSSTTDLTAHPYHAGGWDAGNVGGNINQAAYAFRHDMVQGGRRAQTPLETRIDMYVQSMMQKKENLKGWWPRVEKIRGGGYCFDVIFLRPKMFGCTIEGTVAVGSTWLNMARWESEPGTGRWDLLPQSEMVSEELQQQEDEAPEPVPAHDI